MPQETNLNVTPYFDDFDDKKNYYKVLFKPGYPVQARELTTLQSILQNQIEKFGSHIFKEGSPVLGGSIVYDNYYEGIQVESNYLGLSVDSYLGSLIGKYIVGQDSKVKARIEKIIPANESPTKNTIIYVAYRDSNVKNIREFNDGEILLTEESIPFVSGGVTSIQAGQGVCRAITQNASVTGASLHIASGVYFIRGYFVNVDEETIILDPLSNNVNYSVGLKIFEDVVTFDDDESLSDNSQGFSNYAAPGADRFSIKVKLAKYAIDENQDEGYVELVKIRNGIPDKVVNKSEYNELANEFARRTYDESGDYYVTPFTVTVNESLDNLKGNKGIFKEGQSTYGNQIANESLGVYKISPGKAYIRGFEVDVPNPSFIDFPKPRVTKTLVNQSLVYKTGSTLTLNRVHGTPLLGISTNYTLSLRSERVGTNNNAAAGKEIGIARVYDFALESGSYNPVNENTNEWDITLFDVQPYTEITLNGPISLQTPTYIKGSSSGATAFLTQTVSNSGILTAYNVNGKFLKGERLSFDRIQNNRIITSIKSYDVDDFKSIYGAVGAGTTFSADVVQKVKQFVGPVTISPYTAGISTVTRSDIDFNKIAKVDDIVSFSTPGEEELTYGKIVSVGEKTLNITKVTPVNGICNDTFSSSLSLNVFDFKVLTSSLQTSTDNTLYTVFPHDKIASTNLEKSEIAIRRQKTINITNNSSATIVLADDERFLPYDEERYALVYQNGNTEPLRADQFVITLGSQSLKLNGLSVASGTAILTYTIKKLNVTAKIKTKNRVNSIVVDKSKYNYSGVGQTTINDGLTFGNYPYGTRVHDEEISLNYPDVTKILGVFETTSATENPIIPQVEFFFNEDNTYNLILGEEFVGEQSNCVAIVVERTNTGTIGYISLNSSSLMINETVRFKESGVVATIKSINLGNCKNITGNYRLDNGQRDTFYDYGRIIRKQNVREPLKKLRIVFESTGFSDADTGSIVTVDSYKQFDYCDIPSINNLKNYNILDLRPRVSVYSVIEGARSPFESLSNNFINEYNSNTPILASDEDIILDYSYYLPRIDKIILSKEGQFQLLVGESSETPQAPLNLTEALDIATVTLPAYFCSNETPGISLAQHKRYRMSDIKKLEDRIKNLEFYTTLSLLETETANFTIKDANGLDRFKSGFFVDNFTTLIPQKLTTTIKNSVDVENSQLRPSVYTTSIDLILGHTDANGVINFNNDTFDYKSNQAIVGTNIKKSVSSIGKGILTLDYSEREEIRQPYATRVENVTPYLVTFYGGIADLNPSSDIWMDPVVLDPINLGIQEREVVDSNHLTLLGVPDPKEGWAPMVFGAWETSWTNISAPREFSRGEKYQVDGKWYQDVIYATDKQGADVQRGTTTRITYTDTPVSYGNNVVGINIATYCRSRNIEVISRKLKPFTEMYAFFDGQGVNRYMVPKLLEIEMESGIFQVGETIETDTSLSSSTDPYIKFRLCQPNHKQGRYDSPTLTYDLNPYERTQTIPSSYSASSNLLNIDTFILAEQAIGNYYGYVTSGMRLIGKTSGAVAIVQQVRLITDKTGTLMGSFFIPDPSVPSNPRFRSGTKMFRLTSLSSNSTVPGILNSLSEAAFYAQGTITTTQETIATIRNVKRELGQLTVIVPASTTDFSQPTRVEVPAPPPEPEPPAVPSPPPEPSPNNGFGNGDQDAPGGSGPNNNAENAPTPGPSPVPSTSTSPTPSPSPSPDTIYQYKLYSRPGTFTFTVPTGVTSIEATGVGGGGGGGFGREGAPGGGGAGGGVVSRIISVTPGEVLTIYVAAGGKGATSEIKAGDGDSSYLLWKGSELLAKGGTGGSSAAKGTGGDTSGGGGKGEDGRYNPTEDTTRKRGGFGGGAGLVGGGNAGHPTGKDNNNGAIEIGGQGGNGVRFAGSGGNSGARPDPGDNKGGSGGIYGGGGGAGFSDDGGNGASGAFILKWQESIETASEKMIPPPGLDPLAQSFTITAPEGRFVTAVDLFFQSKDDVLPAIIELRPMTLGLPTGDVYPFSQIVLDPKDIQLSEDGSVPTRVEFECPVYLKGNAEHALVIKSDSTNYYVWISRLGEVDITTASLQESGRIIISNQPDISKIGVLFKSQNASTWTPSQFEDLKFTLYAAVFERSGNVSFFNPDLTDNNNHVSILNNNPLEISSKRLKINLSSNLSDPEFKLGNTIVQRVTGATGNYVGAAGSISSISITNTGIGYTPSNGTSYLYENIVLLNSTSSGKNATADITIGRQILPDGSVNDGVAIAATIRSGGYGYEKGDVLSVQQLGDQTLGRNLLFTVDDITSYNQLILDNVQGEFLVGTAYTLRYTKNTGINTNLNYGYSPDVHIEDIEVETDGLHIKVNHPNHGMHSRINTVILSNVQSDVTPAKLNNTLESTTSATVTISLDSASQFTTFENVGVGTTNPGYVLINNEIIKYTGVSGNELIGITRGIENTQPQRYFTNTNVYKYELNKVSLRRINKIHELQDSTILERIGLDSYPIKIDMSGNDSGITDRTLGSPLGSLYFEESKSLGGSRIKATKNIQYEIIKPNIQVMTLPNTSIVSDMRSVSATSVGGAEPSFVDQGYQRIDLNVDNYVNSSRLICSKINETTKLIAQPANKSLEIRTYLSTENNRISPVIDLDRAGAILVTNRINNPVSDYINDSSTSTLDNDPTAFVYATKPISLEVAATSLRVYTAAYVNRNSDIRAFYAILKDASESPIYYPFPGYANRILSGEVININNSDGTPDEFVSNNDLFGDGNTVNYFKDYEFSIDNLASFRYFSIKIVVSSNIQVYPPKLRDLRVIALA